MSILDYLKPTNFKRNKYRPAMGKILDENNNELDLTKIMLAIFDPIDNCISICIQDQHTEPVDALFAQSVSEFTLAVDTVASGVEAGTLIYSFTAVAGHGIAINDEIILLDPDADRSFQAIAIDVVGNVITVDRPIDHVFPATTGLGRIIITNMAVDGSTTPQIFSARAGTVPIDFTRFLVTMLGGNASMDDGLFGNIPALTNGLVFRIVNSFQKTIFTFKTNGDIKQFCFDVSYANNAPAGQTGLSARISFAGPEKHGVTLRIGPDDVLQWIVQDDLTELNALRVAAEGHFTQD